MAFKARIYLQRPAQAHAEYLGEIELDMRPVRGAGPVSRMTDK